MKWLVPTFASALVGSCLGALIGDGLRHDAVDSSTVITLAAMALVALLVRIAASGWLSS